MKVTIPTSFSDLTQEQLIYFYSLRAEQRFSDDQLLTLCFFKFAKGDNGATAYNLKRKHFIETADGQIYNSMHWAVLAKQVAAVLPTLSFLTQTPETPVRVESIRLHKIDFYATEAHFTELPLKDYLVIENLFTGFLHTQNSDLLLQCFPLLYHCDEKLDANVLFKNMNLTEWETNFLVLNLGTWLAGLKNFYLRLFPDLFVQSIADLSDLRTLRSRLADSANSMIFALTEGDITRDEAVLQQSTFRAMEYINYKIKQSKKPTENS